MSKIHGKKEQVRAVDMDDEQNVTIFEIHDTETQQEIEELEKKLVEIKEKIRDRVKDL